MPLDGLSTRTLANLLYYSGGTFLDWGDRARAEELWGQLDEVTSHTRDAQALLFPLVTQIALATMDGHLEDAVEAGERLIARSEELGSPMFGRQFANMSLSSLLHLGRAPEAQETLSQTAEANRLAGVQSTGGIGLPFLALVLAHLGRHDEAKSTLDQAITQRGISIDNHELPTNVHLLLLETVVIIGDRSSASLLASTLAGKAPIHELIPTCVARHLGAAAALLGDREKAKEYYQQALEVCARVRFRPEIALTRLQLAELLLEEAEEIEQGSPHPNPLPKGEGTSSLPPGERGEPSSPSTGEDTGGGDASSNSIRKEAMAHLDFAIGEFQEMKMGPSLERALRHKGLLKA